MALIIKLTVSEIGAFNLVQRVLAPLSETVNFIIIMAIILLFSVGFYFLVPQIKTTKAYIL